jgi:hypothetical protein
LIAKDNNAAGQRIGLADVLIVLRLLSGKRGKIITIEQNTVQKIRILQKKHVMVFLVEDG